MPAFSQNTSGRLTVGSNFSLQRSRDGGIAALRPVEAGR
jgi:hypothetical protein